MLAILFRLQCIKWECDFRLFSKTQHITHLQQFVDNMCKYGTDPASIVEDTERTQFRLQIDRQAEGRAEGQMEKVNQYTPLNFIGGGGL